MAISEAAAGVRVVVAPNPSAMTLDGTRTYIVGRRRPLVVDPGPALAEHLGAVVRALEGAIPAALVVTHAHADHSGAAAELARRTRASIRMAPGAIHGVPIPSAMVELAGDGDRIELDDGVAELMATPGHAPEHLSVHWTGGSAHPGGAVFVGDLLMGEGDTALVAPPEGDLGRYLASLDRVESLGADVLYPAHGPPLRDPAEAIRRYRAHREARIEQVRRALAAHPDADAERLVSTIYGEALDPALREAAAGSIRAVMGYLREVG